jgi:hypothetical protein
LRRSLIEIRERPGARLGVLDREAPDSALVVHAWPTLSEPLRAAVLALARTAQR